MKLIGITSRIMTEKSVEKQFVNTRYAKQLTDRGLNVILLLANNPDIEEILPLCDGFLITGGTDLDPNYFNEENEGLSEGIKPELDLLDKAVVEHAVKTKKPILGICRGHQSINVFLGGSLHQHIGDDHTDIPNGHVVKVLPNKHINFKETIEVNSYHHQAVKKPAEGLDVIAYAEDNTIEAYVHQSLPIIGVQWHPEILANSEETKLIFDLFHSYFKK